MAVTNLDELQLAGGISVPAGQSGPTVWATGGAPPAAATTGTDTTPVVTETYVARVFIPVNGTITGISILNGSAVAGNMQLGLFNSAGVLVAQTASTAQSGTAAYQDVAFTTAYAAKGPGMFFIAAQFNNTSARFRTHAVGRFTAFKKTGETYGTFTALTNPNSFTTALGPIASTY